MARILIAYSTVDGHTRSICERIAGTVRQRGHEIEFAAIDEGAVIDLSAFDKIVIGASIRYGKHRPQVTELINANQAILESKPSAFFSVNVVARKPEKNTPETNPYLRKFLDSIAWQPENLAVFAGRIDYPSYGFLDRLAIRFIMWMTKGPTDPNAVVEFTDWNKVDEFANRVAEM
jgi:menaquinone-dependent protoporphyrinogen oxidase